MGVCQDWERQGVFKMTIQLDVATLIYIASCIGILATAVKVLYSAKKALLKPLDEIDATIKSHDKFLENDKKQLEKIDYVLADITDSMNMLIKSHKTVLMHLEDGNHTGEIKREINELDEWLVESRGRING